MISLPGFRIRVECRTWFSQPIMYPYHLATAGHQHKENNKLISVVKVCSCKILETCTKGNNWLAKIVYNVSIYKITPPLRVLI